MTCPHCQSTAVRRRRQRTAPGHRRFWCDGCGRRCSEQSGSPYNDLPFPTDVVLLAVLWWLRYNSTSGGSVVVVVTDARRDAGHTRRWTAASCGALAASGTLLDMAADGTAERRIAYLERLT